MRKIRKLVGAALGGVTGAVVVSVAGMLGWELTPELAGAVATILAAFGAWVAPANEGADVRRG